MTDGGGAVHSDQGRARLAGAEFRLIVDLLCRGEQRVANDVCLHVVCIRVGRHTHAAGCSPGQGTTPRLPTGIPLWIGGYFQRMSLRVVKVDYEAPTNRHWVSVVGLGLHSPHHDTLSSNNKAGPVGSTSFKAFLPKDWRQDDVEKSLGKASVQPRS